MTSSRDAHGPDGLGPQGPAPMPVRLGEALVKDAGLSPADLNRALAVASARGLRLGSALIELGLFSADDIAMALAQQLGVASVRDKHLEAIDPHTRAMISPAIEQRVGAVAVALTRDEPPHLVVAMRDPRDARAIAELEAASGLKVTPAAAAASRIEAVTRPALPSTLMTLIREAVPPRPTGIPLTGASPLLDLDALPQRTTPWNAAARAAALEARKARGRTPGLTPPMPGMELPAPEPSVVLADPIPRQTTLPPPVASASRITTPPPIAAAPPVSAASVALVPPPASGTSVAPAPSALWPAVTLAGAVVLVGALGYIAYQRLSSTPPIAAAAPPLLLEAGLHHLPVGLAVPLGAGWRVATTGSPGYDAIYQGDDPDHPRTAIVFARVHRPGAFSPSSDAHGFEAFVNAWAQQGASQDFPRGDRGDKVVLSLGGCAITTLRPEPTGVCTGTVTYPWPQPAFAVRAYVWIAGADDQVAVYALGPEPTGATVEQIVAAVGLD